MKKLILAAIFAVLSTASFAQSPVPVVPCYQTGGTCTPVSAANPLPVTGGGGGGGGTSSAFDAVFPANGTAIGISDGTNMKAWLAAIALGDGVNGNNMGSVAPWWWNGTTWDRTSPLGLTGDSAATAGGTGSLSAKLRLMTTQLDNINTNVQNPVAGVSQAQTSAAASSLVAKASAGSVISISGSAVSGSYIMLFNATSAPADGAVTPKKCWGPMAAAGPFAFSWGVGPIYTMSTGITVVSSSTGCYTKTATNAAFISVEYQ